MDCQECGAWSMVKETRDRGGYTYRRYECANMHRFSTKEVVYDPNQKGEVDGRDNRIGELEEELLQLRHKLEHIYALSKLAVHDGEAERTV